ncbi:type II secretion system protein N [Allopusillimonas ginsengisoli]|uniref:type II secretion system protein N n=1 Tax=Allopusillimonas ginsengisoli TaxID=453575 RepID=UPI0010C18FFB|nr:type II secretion system protein N [Allopusillimonas ginsengisoli]
MRPGARTVWVVLLFTAALTAALIVLPARWVMAWIPDSSPVIVTNASGTLWDATATVAVGAEGLRRTLPDPVQWRFDLDGWPRLALTHPWLRGPLHITLSWRGLKVSAQSLQLPASVLTTVHALFNTLDPGGEVFLTWPDLILARTVAASQGAQLLSAQWRNASSSLTRVHPMGNYTLLVSGADNSRLSLLLRTDQGPLHMEGNGTLSASGRVKFDGKAWASASAPRDTQTGLQNLLSVMGPSSGQGGETLLQIR